VLLALPVAAVSMVLLRYAHEHYRRSELYAVDHPGDDPEAIAEEPEAVVAPSAQIAAASASAANDSMDPPAPYPEP
jgi:hypothetical protein